MTCNKKLKGIAKHYKMLQAAARQAKINDPSQPDKLERVETINGQRMEFWFNQIGAALNGKPYNWINKSKGIQSDNTFRTLNEAITDAKKVNNAKHSGVAQIPQDYKKQLNGKASFINRVGHHYKTAKHSKTILHGIMPNPVIEAQFSSTVDYARLEIAFLTEGWYNTNGTEYKYDWEVIDKNKESFIGKPFFLNHAEASNREMGVIDDVYTKVIQGKNWLVANVKIPKMEFAKDFLDRVKAGLIKEFSSTHEFRIDPTNPEKKVTEIRGKALSSVVEGEVPNTSLLSAENLDYTPKR